MSDSTRKSSRQDVIGFRRIFVLFCTLVLLPSLLMSGFGIIAITNESAADKQRRREQATELLRDAESVLKQTLERTDASIAVAAQKADATSEVSLLINGGAPVGPWLVVDAAHAFVAGDPRFLSGGALSARLLRLLSDVQIAHPVHAFVDDNSFAGVVSVQRLANGSAVAYGIDPAVLERAMRQQLPPSLMTTALHVDAPAQLAVENATSRLVAVNEPLVLPSGREELVVSRLLPPFDALTLVIDAPPSGTSAKTIAAYIILMVVFLSTMITGVVVTARLIWQETRLSRLKTDFVSHMSHELRTPLTSIRMFIETLRFGRAQSEEEKQECLDLLTQETERLSDMIERVLGYARLRAGRRLFSPRVVQPQVIIDDALAAFRAQNLTATDFDLTMRVESGLPSIRVDHEAMVEALLNLVGNAHKHAGAHKQVTVEAKRGKKGRVLLAVKDNGPGIAKGEHKRVFERFYQSGGLLSSKKPGSGLGLAITKAIVEGNGGKVAVESELGKGATFIIEVPEAAAP